MKSTPSAHHRNVEVLVAEDSRTQAEQLKYLLEEAGYAVAVTADGRQALAAARARKPTLIISDIVMPETDGYSLCRQIKSDEELKDVPVVLVTELSTPRDVLKGLECGADNFITKPYEGKYLLSRIEYILTNRELRKREKMQLGVEIYFAGQRHFVTAERQQILDLLISTYENAVRINDELQAKQAELARSYQSLKGLYRVAGGLSQAQHEQEVIEKALEGTLELPGIQAGWLFLRQGQSGFRLAGARGLPPALEAAGALEGDCLCRRQLLAGELDSVANILECERLQKAPGETRGLRYHATVPLWVGEHTIGVLNLVRADQGLFSDNELEVLFGAGHQIAVALERARLHEQVENQVDELASANRELELRRQEAERASQFKSQFLASMSHELRTPLNAIIGFSDLLADASAGPLNEKQQRFADHILTAGRHLLQLINDILDLAKIEAGQLELSPEDFSVAELLPEVLSVIKPLAMRKKIEVETRMTADLRVSADRVRFKQILYNLLSNALKFTPEGGAVVIETSAQGELVRLSVSDTGIGIRPEDQEAVFQEFLWSEKPPAAPGREPASDWP